MILEEAIKHCEEVADSHERIKQIKAVTLEECRCANEHRQLAEWLRELKAFKEQNPCEDAISREAALEAILISLPDFSGDEGGNLIDRNETASAIQNLPSVTHARPKGHWIREFDDIEGEVRFICSNCRKHQLFESDFCYHCGSDNGKEEE